MKSMLFLLLVGLLAGTAMAMADGMTDGIMKRNFIGALIKSLTRGRENANQRQLRYGDVPHMYQ